MVNMNQRKPPSELNIISKAKDLLKHTYQMTNNTNHFPKKVRFTIVQRMQNCATDILELLVEANDLNLSIPEQKSQRLILQARALTKCKLLLYYIELSFESNHINGGSCSYWSQMVVDVKNMTATWSKKDKTRE